jgi:hypothetical protein
MSMIFDDTNDDASTFFPGNEQLTKHINHRRELMELDLRRTKMANDINNKLMEQKKLVQPAIDQLKACNDILYTYITSLENTRIDTYCTNCGNDTDIPQFRSTPEIIAYRMKIDQYKAQYKELSNILDNMITDINKQIRSLSDKTDQRINELRELQSKVEEFKLSIGKELLTLLNIKLNI